MQMFELAFCVVTKKSGILELKGITKYMNAKLPTQLRTIVGVKASPHMAYAHPAVFQAYALFYFCLQNFEQSFVLQYDT